MSTQPVDEARERVALWMMQNSYATGHGDTLADLLIELVGQAREEGYKEGTQGNRARRLTSGDGVFGGRQKWVRK